VLNKFSEQTLRFIFVLIALYCGILTGIPLIKAAFTERLTVDGSFLDYNYHGKGVKIAFVKSEDAADLSGIKPGDIIVAVNGNEIENYEEFQHSIDKIHSGEFAIYSVQRGIIIFDTKVNVYKYFHLIFFIFTALGFGFLINGFFVGYSRPKEFISQVFFLLGCSACLGLIIYGGVWRYTGTENFLDINFNIALAVFYSLFMHFFLIYPKEYNLKHRKIVLWSVYLYPILITAFLMIFGNIIQANFNILLIQFFSFSPIILVIIGIYLFIRSYLNISDARLKKHLRIILNGLILGGIGIFYYFFIFTPISSSQSANMSYYLRLPAVFVLAIPVSFGYSIFKYRILDTEFIIKKGIVFGIVSTFIAGCYLLFAYFLESYFLVEFQGNKLLLYIALMYIFIITFNFVNKGAKKFVDKKFYRDRYNYRKALLKFSTDLPYINNLQEAIYKLDSTLKDTMGLSDVSIYVFDEEYEKLIKARKGTKRTEPEEIQLLRKKVFKYLFENNNSPVFLYGVNLAELDLPYNYEEFIQHEKIVLSVPIFVKDKFIGSINFGEKPNNKTFSDEDVDLLRTLVSQTSVMFENTRLKLEELNKKMIEEELQIAKNIQMGLLPKEHIKIQGLDISGSTYPARMIGGDFYDFVKLDDKRLLLIVADVSGNGIPAALYMAKIQAIIRFASKIFKNPKDIFIEVNKQVYKKFEKGSFVTMVLALFDLNDNKVKISRAGHNPVIFSNNGKLNIIQSKGIGLGLENEIIFENNLEEIELDLQVNSMFLFYTDGLNEAMNENKEEYGMDRIYSLINNTKQENAQIIHTRLIESVNNFRNETEQNDDISVVVVKVEY